MCEELRRAGHLPLVRQRTGLVLDPYFSATKAAWLLRSGELALGADDPNLSFCTVDSWVLWNLTGGPDGGVYATDPSNASRTLLFDTAELAWSPELCELFGVPPHALPEVRPSAGRFGTAALGRLHGAAATALDGVPIAAILGDQQAALFGQACFSPGMVKVTYGTGSFVLANVGAERPGAPEGLTVSCAWDLGDHADERDRVAYALEGSAFVSGAAIQWLRDGLGIIDERGRRRAARRDGARQRRRRLRPRAHRTGQPALGSRRHAASSPASPAARAAPTWRAPASRRWPSRCVT